MNQLVFVACLTRLTYIPKMCQPTQIENRNHSKYTSYFEAERQTSVAGSRSNDICLPTFRHCSSLISCSTLYIYICVYPPTYLSIYICLSFHQSSRLPLARSGASPVRCFTLAELLFHNWRVEGRLQKKERVHRDGLACKYVCICLYLIRKSDFRNSPQRWKTFEVLCGNMDAGFD